MWVGVAVILTASIMAGGGYWYLRSQAPAAPAAAATPRPTPAAVSPDDGISSAVKASLAAVPELQSLQVAVRDGVVTLSGPVATQNLAEQAVRIAAAQPSVKEVRNQIDFPPVAVAPPVETPVRASPPQTKAKPEPKAAAAKPVRERKEPAAPRGPSAQERRHVQELLADGERLTNSGAYAAAIDAYNSALAIDPNDSSAKAGLNRARQAKATEEEILLRRRK